MPEEGINKEQLIKEIVNKIWNDDLKILNGTAPPSLSNVKIKELQTKLILLGTTYEIEVNKRIERIKVDGVKNAYVRGIIDVKQQT